MKQISKLLTLLLLMACNNSGTKSNDEVKTKTDSLRGEVMEAHNIGMAKMEKISEAQKKVQHAMDSISKLPANLQKQSVGYKMQLDSILGRLKYSDYAMNQWMEEFNMDSEANNTERQIKYMESEKIKISKVKDAMISSLQKADSLLKAKF